MLPWLDADAVVALWLRWVLCGIVWYCVEQHVALHFDCASVLHVNRIIYNASISTCMVAFQHTTYMMKTIITVVYYDSIIQSYSVRSTYTDCNPGLSQTYYDIPCVWRAVADACARISKPLVVLGVLLVVMPAEYAAFGYVGRDVQRIHGKSFCSAMQRCASDNNWYHYFVGCSQTSVNPANRAVPSFTEFEVNGQRSTTATCVIMSIHNHLPRTPPSPSTLS